ncbi:MAG: extracellular solute-binding protein [Chloroflexota bacterium]
MKTKKSFWLALTTFILISLIAGACAAPPPETPAEQPPVAETTAPPAQTEAPPPSTEAPPAASDVTGKLIMLDWSGYELPEFWKPFADKYPKVTVDFSFLTESAEVYAKLQSGFEADLVHPCSNYWKILVDENMVQPIDTSRLKNWPGVIPSLAKQGEFNGKQYWIPWDWGFESILVRKDLVQKVPESWADIWDPQYAGHISLFDSGESAHIITSLALGFDPWNTTPEQDEQIRQKLLELAPNVLAYWGSQTDLDNMLASGDAWLGVNAWNASYTNLLGQGLDVVYIDPKEGRAGYLCGFAIPTSSKNYDLALEMIDAYLAPESMAYLANEYGYGVANAEALPLVDPEMIKLLSLDDQAIIDRTIFYQYITPEQREAWTNVWSEVKTSQ